MRKLISLSDSLPFFLFGSLAFLAPKFKFWSLTHSTPLAWLFFLLGFLFWLRNVLRKQPQVEQPASAGLNAAGLQSVPGNSVFSGAIVGKTILVLLPVVAFFLFIFFRQRNFLPPPQGLGDSLQLIQIVPVFSHLFGYKDSFDELLELYIHSRFYIFSLQTWKLSIEESYALLSSLTGAGYVLLTALYLRKRTPVRKIYGGALLLMTPALQLYAGYVENYTLVAFTISLILILGVESLSSDVEQENRFLKSPLFLPLLALLSALAALLHMIAGLLAPALAYLVWVRSGRRIDRFAKMAATTVIPALLLMAGVWAIFLFLFDHPPSFGDSHLSHPPLLSPGRLFSLVHFRDLLNQLLLGAPLTLPLLFALRPGRIIAPAIRRETAENATDRNRIPGVPVHLILRENETFSLIATVSFAIPAFLIHPLLGYPADWDLMTFFQIPLNLFLLQLLFRQTANTSPFHLRRLPSPVALFTLGALLTFSWIGHNSRVTPESEHHLREAHESSRLFLDSITGDSAFAAIRSTDREKIYVKIGLFILDSRRFLEKENDTILLEQLNRADFSFRQIMTLPDESYARELALLWKELTRINLQITGKRQNAIPHR